MNLPCVRQSTNAFHILNYLILIEIPYGGSIVNSILRIRIIRRIEIKFIKLVTKQLFELTLWTKCEIVILGIVRIKIQWK